ncbi:hypothetical protein BDV34DRAFT_65876 [Aspergillus parasiticus]|uniref:Uncharacterized protein n=1 Tax=Aspergillus parasiticus TaxID=5067 RepID=A0A5N6DQN7_ASPPA|nr:hypothetical protein BDV34DRAFT_65876 [Aspergillus parasiticus]
MPLTSDPHRFEISSLLVLLNRYSRSQQVKTMQNLVNGQTSRSITDYSSMGSPSILPQKTPRCPERYLKRSETWSLFFSHGTTTQEKNKFPIYDTYNFIPPVAITSQAYLSLRTAMYHSSTNRRMGHCHFFLGFQHHYNCFVDFSAFSAY